MKLSASLTALGLTIFALGGVFVACDSEEEVNKGSDGAGGATALGEFCEDDADCAADGLLCDSDQLSCVECKGDSDCNDSSLCELGACVEQELCSSSDQCSGTQVCKTAKQYCVDCLADSDCGDGFSCVSESCQADCESDQDCRASGGVCSEASSVCFECEESADCAAGQYCSDEKSCLPFVCEPEEKFCNGESAVSCKEDGSGYEQKSCDDGCAQGECVGESSDSDDTDGDDTGSGDADTDGDEPVDGDGDGDKPAACEEATADYCDLIPAFTGTQVVDGKDDEFCNVPAMELTYADAGYQNLKNMSASTTGSKVLLHAAWDSDALHLHARIETSSVNVNSFGKWYEQDNLQVFFKGNAPTGGTMETDKAIQLGYNPPVNMTPTFEKITQTNAAPPQDFITVESFAREVEGGYEVEVKASWPNSVAPSSGAEMAFNFIVGENSGSNFDYEYGLNIAANPSCTQGGTGIYCNTNNWCSPKAE